MSDRALQIVACMIILFGMVVWWAFDDHKRTQCIDTGRTWSCRNSGRVHCTTNDNHTTCQPELRCWCER